METQYWHLHEIKVKRGDKVEPGDTIGTMGNTGNSQGAHLHFELMPTKLTSRRVNALPGYHWEDRRANKRNPNPLFICTLCDNSKICRGRDSENSGNHNFVYNADFDPTFFDNTENATWWTQP